MTSLPRRPLLRGLAATLLAAPALAACAPLPPPIRPTQEVSFSDRLPIGLNVSRIEVVERYRAPGIAPHIEHVAPTRPAQAVRIWAYERLSAEGVSGTAQVIIDEASLIEEDLPRTQGWRAYVTVDQASRVTLVLNVRILAENQAVRLEGTVTGQARRSMTIAENASQAERNMILNQLVVEAMADLDRSLERDIRQRLGALVRG